MPHDDESLSSKIDDEANEEDIASKEPGELTGFLTLLPEIAWPEAETALRQWSRNVLDTSTKIFAVELTMEPMKIQEAKCNL